MSELCQGPACPVCRRDSTKAHGSVRGRKRWQCKACDHSFTRTTPRGHDGATRHMGVA